MYQEDTERLLAKIEELEIKNKMLTDSGNRMAEILERFMLDLSAPWSTSDQIDALITEWIDAINGE